MAIKNLSDVLMKLNKKRKRQPEGTIDLFDGFDGNPREKKKPCQVHVEDGFTKKKHKSSDIKLYTTEKTVKLSVSHENVKRKRKSAEEKSSLNKIEDTNTATHSSKPQEDKKPDVSGINDKNINNVAETIKSKRRRKRKNSTPQVNLQECTDEKTVATIGKEVPNVQIKSEINSESFNCDIMLNVTSEPVKPKKENKDFFNDVHSNIEKMNKRRKAFVSQPEEYVVLGDLKSQIEDHEPHEEGVKLSFKKAKLSKRILHYHQGSGLAYAKKAYKNLVKGDLIVQFKNSNLHEIAGYGKQGQ